VVIGGDHAVVLRDRVSVGKKNSASIVPD